MRLYLMQHGKSLPEGIDPARPLSPVGREQIVRSAEAMRHLGIQPDVILSSDRMRTIETAEILADVLNVDINSIRPNPALRPRNPAGRIIDLLDEHRHLSTIIAVGHMPSLERVAASLLGRNNRLALQMKHGGLMRISLNNTLSRARLDWLLMPEHLSLLVADNHI